jgi:hypothetical protein
MSMKYFQISELYFSAIFAEIELLARFMPREDYFAI